MQIIGVYNYVITLCSPGLFVLFCYFISFLFSQLKEEFEMTQQKNNYIDGSTLDSFRRRHARICLLVDIADNAFSPILAIAFITNTVGILFMSYYIFTHQYTSQFELHQFVVWLTFSFAILISYSLSAVWLHEQVSTRLTSFNELEVPFRSPFHLTFFKCCTCN